MHWAKPVAVEGGARMQTRAAGLCRVNFALENLSASNVAHWHVQTTYVPAEATAGEVAFDQKASEHMHV
jgi:hypothetical protein